MSWIEEHGFSIFEGYNLTLLGIDEAWLNISNPTDRYLRLYSLSSDCHKCPYKFLSDAPSNSANKIIISTKYPVTYRFAESNATYLDVDDSYLCGAKPPFKEFGVYDIIASEESKTCSTNTKLEGMNIYLPLVIVTLFYLFLTVSCVLWSKYKWKLLPKLRKMLGFGVSKTASAESQPEQSTGANDAPPVRKKRLRSLDTFRGLCIIIMIFVNDGGARYYFFEHATWDGLYVADLVFPWFLWIMGVCIPISIESQLKRKIPKLQIIKAIVIRSLKLIGIGLILASKGGPVELNKLRLPGVLQRFGICYLVTATTVLFSAPDKYGLNQTTLNKWAKYFEDIIHIWKGWLVALSILLLHTLLTFLLSVPDCPTGYLGPGGLHLFTEWDKYPNASSCIGGAAGLIDNEILTTKHIYQWPTALSTYDSTAYDPEGILGTLTSIFQVWLGVQAGFTLKTYQSHVERLARWSAWAVVTGSVGAALCEGKMTGGLIPVNKNLWSLSYVMVTTCFALALLITLYMIIDIREWWNGTPFFEPGMNSILLYVGHSVANVMLPFHFEYKDHLDTHFLRLVEALWGTSMWVLVAIYLHRINYFWSL